MPPLSSQEDWSASIDAEELLLGKELSALVNDDMVLQEYAKKSVIRAEDFSEEACYHQLMNIIGTM